MSAVIATEQGYEFLPDAWSPMDPWAPRETHVYYLEITYPPGSGQRGWKPRNWHDPEFLARLSRKARRAHVRREFRWPRERMFLSSSGAHSRAALLRCFGATVKVHRSMIVLWPGVPGDEAEFDASGLPKAAAA